MDWLKKAEAIFFMDFNGPLLDFPAIYSLLLNANSGNYLHLWHHFVWTSEWGGNYDINLYASQSGGGTMTSICMHLRGGGNYDINLYASQSGGGTMTSLCRHLRVGGGGLWHHFVCSSEWGGGLWHHIVGISEWGGTMTSLYRHLRVGGAMTSLVCISEWGGNYDITLYASLSGGGYDITL